jgi:hypothetical protein
VEANWHFTLQMYSDVFDLFISPVSSQKLGCAIPFFTQHMFAVFTSLRTQGTP